MLNIHCVTATFSYRLGSCTVHSSCNFRLSLFDFVGDRAMLNHWAEKKGEQGIEDYWQEKNSVSLDGVPIRISDD